MKKSEFLARVATIRSELEAYATAHQGPEIPPYLLRGKPLARKSRSNPSNFDNTLLMFCNSLGYYKTSRAIQNLYDSDLLSYTDAKLLMKKLRSRYIKAYGEYKDWLSLR